MTENTTLNLGEHGRDPKTGEPRTVDARLYMQLQAFGECRDEEAVIDAVRDAAGTDAFEAVVYKDLNDPLGIAVLAAHEDPEFFVGPFRELLSDEPFLSLLPESEYTMFGRSYSIGYETNLEDILLHRPRRRICSPDYGWAVWYPLRRAGSFEQLDKEQQNQILMEHAALGIQFSQAGKGQDIRLACHGLDKNDNDFVIGLLGGDLYPLSAMVQSMRKTTQTSLHLESLGPFFIGRVLWQSPIPVTSAQPEETPHG